MKTFIKNRKGQKMSVIIEENPSQKGLAFIMHGLGGFKEQPHIQTFAQSFRDGGFSLVLFDTTNTFGESEGNYEDATTTNYYEDLEDVIDWAKNQNWYQEPFWLTGHSLGGISTALFAEKYPEKIKGLAPISTVVSGKLTLETPQYKNNDVLEQWKKTGIRETPSGSNPGLIKRLKWAHVADRLKYDLVPEAGKLTMPVLMIVGDKDESTPLEHQQILFEKLPGKKELHVIKNSDHNFRGNPDALSEIKSIFDKWIESNL